MGQGLHDREDRAVSPVIGVILMVAITVILAAVTGAFALELQSEGEEMPAKTQLLFEYDEAADNLTVKHDDGERIPEGNIEFAGDTTATTPSDCAGGGWASQGDKITSGDTCVLENIGDSDQVTVRWVGNSKSAILNEWDGADG